MEPYLEQATYAFAALCSISSDLSSRSRANTRTQLPSQVASIIPAKSVEDVGMTIDPGLSVCSLSRVPWRITAVIELVIRYADLGMQYLQHRLVVASDFSVRKWSDERSMRWVPAF
jgi:hypothetical protein